MSNSEFIHSNKELFKRCLSYFKPYYKVVIVASIAMLVSGLCSSGAAWLVKPAMDEIFVSKNKNYLLLIPFMFFLITLGKVGGRLVQNYLLQYCGLKVLETLREQLYTKIISLPLRFYEGSETGKLMSYIINDVLVIRSSLPAVISSISQIITMCGLMFVVFYRDTELAFWAVIVLPVAFFPFIYFGRRLRKLSRKNQSKLADISKVLHEILSGVRVVKAFGTEKVEGERFGKENKRLIKTVLKQCLAGESSSSAMELIGAIGIGIVIWIGGSQVIDGVATPGTFFSFVAALLMMYEPLKKLTSANNDIQKAISGAERVFSILDNPSVVEESGGNVKFSPPFKNLEFLDVNFTYPDGTEALKNASFEIKEGQRIAIVGPSGAGKTTFVNLIPRFYDITSGKILLNGVELHDYTLESLRHNISLVSQDSFLFNLSVAENIAYGIKDAKMEDIENAALAAFASEFIESLPEKYNTIIGERGVKLSGGQKQRLTIARAIMKNAPLLILDEATSALDTASERIVQRALDNLMQNKTSIVIAHRLSTILNADQILVMERGKIIASGKHEELLKHSKLYNQLYSMQFLESN